MVPFRARKAPCRIADVRAPQDHSSRSATRPARARNAPQIRVAQAIPLAPHAVIPQDAARRIGSDFTRDTIDIRPVVHILGQIMIALAVLMVPPLLVDWQQGSHNAPAFVASLLITGITGTLLTLATRGTGNTALSIRQAYLLTSLIWSVLPFFGALPFMLGEPGLSLTDAYFESVSGITTTGATVIYGLDLLPDGTNLWRGLLNWTGGLGIVFVAMIFMPVMRVGGMQMFRAEGFDTFGKVLPRAQDIAKALLQVYLILSLVVYLTYLGLGMHQLDALVNAMATVSTGGFSSSDTSFSGYIPAVDYMAALFMLAAALPYVRYIQLMRGEAQPLWRDPQVRFFLSLVAVATAIVTAWAFFRLGIPFATALRDSFFNLVSISTGTGFFAGTFAYWEGPALVVAFIVGLVGGCSGSSTGALSAFRVLLTLRIIGARILQIQSPNRVIPLRYDGQRVEEDVVDSLILFTSAFLGGIGLFAVAMTLTGVDSYSALMGAWMSLSNIGYGFGPLVAATGTFIDYPDAAKWLMSLAMLLGRLGLLSIFVLLLPRFWHR